MSKSALDLLVEGRTKEIVAKPKDVTMTSEQLKRFADTIEVLVGFGYTLDTIPYDAYDRLKSDNDTTVGIIRNSLINATGKPGFKYDREYLDAIGEENDSEFENYISNFVEAEEEDEAMKDYEEISFNNQVEMQSYLEEQKETDVWQVMWTNEIDVLPLLGVHPFMYRNGGVAIKGRQDYDQSFIAKEVTDEDLETSMANSKLMAMVHVLGSRKIYPLRYTAFSHVCARAGLGGRSITDLRSRRRHDEIDSTKRAEMLNECLRLYKDRTNVLVRDGKITAMMSGDENDYKVLPAADLLKALTDKLEQEFPGYIMIDGKLSHEIVVATFDLGSDGLCNQIKGVLRGYGVEANDVKARLRFSTSDVGLSEARLAPVVEVDGVTLGMGNTYEIKHSGQASVEKFGELADKVLINYRDNIADIERLASIHVRNARKCLESLYENIGIKGYAKELDVVANRIEAEHVSGECTAFDLLYYLNEMVYLREEQQATEGKRVDLLKSLKDKEMITNHVLRTNFNMLI